MVGFTITAGLSEFEDFALFCLFMLLPMKKQVVYIFIHGRSSFSPLILSVTLETDKIPKNTLMDGCCERQMHGEELGKGWQNDICTPL